jgi:hypothetical protein
LKFAWRNNIGDLAAWNSVQVEEIDEMKEYRDLLVADLEQDGGRDGYVQLE